MKKYILLIIGSFTSFILAAQPDLEKRKALVNDMESFLNAYAYYTTLKTNYNFYFLSLPENHFSWDISGTGKFYTIDEIVKNLEHQGASAYSEKLRSNLIEFLRKLYDQYRLPMLEKEMANLVAKDPWNSFPYVILNDSIIDISNCFWKKTGANNYQLTNSIDTLKKFDPWRQQKPKKREAVGFEIILRYYNYTDSTITPSVKDSFQTQWIKKNNSISPDIYGLVNSEYFKKKALYENDVPAVIQKWLNELLEELMKELSPNWAAAVNNIKISYANLPSETLWFKSNESSIFLSPFLIRAVYIKHIYERFHGKIEEIPAYIDGLKYSRQRTLKDDQDIYRILKTGFQRHFIFLLLHELAHPLIDKLKLDNTEELCDCNAAKLIQDKKLNRSLGIFEEILAQSVKEGSDNLWDVSNPKSILTRLNQLKNTDGSFKQQSCGVTLK